LILCMTIEVIVDLIQDHMLLYQHNSKAKDTI
jgi:hypothetical protein